MKLPGIGPYTAGAVACFAYERDAAFLNTNMRRILHRYFFGLKAATTATNKELSKIVGKLVPPQRGWRWNPALMETGALVCTARSPRCEECPLREGCRARIEAASAGWPKPERKTPAYRYEDSNRYYRGRVLAELRGRARIAKALRCASSAGGSGTTSTSRIPTSSSPPWRASARTDWRSSRLDRRRVRPGWWPRSGHLMVPDRKSRKAFRWIRGSACPEHCG